MAFHRQIVEAAGNAVLLRVWDSLMLEVRTRIGLNQLDVDLTFAAETHGPIVEAFTTAAMQETRRAFCAPRALPRMFRQGEQNTAVSHESIVGRQATGHFAGPQCGRQWQTP